MRYTFHPAAEEEFNAGIDYYEDCRTGLGFEFADEVYLTVERILSYPVAWQEIDSDIRRSLVNRFPMAYFIL